jgi:YgiT-type zinc finger domain-containing protein
MRCCAICQGERLEASTAPDRLTIGSVVFVADLPCLRCTSCGEVFFEALDLRRFERAAASELLTQPPTGPALRFVRKLAGLAGKELARLVDVTPETVSHWETGKSSVPRVVWALVGTLFAERLRQETSTLDRLRGLATCQPLREVHLTLPPEARSA